MSSPNLKSLFLLSLPYLILAGICGGLLFQAYQSCDSQHIYPLDDAYIHLSLAKQVADTGDWGLSPGKFHSSSSSPLYIVLLAFARLFYEGDTISLIINAGGALLLILGIQIYLRGNSFSDIFICLFSISVIVLGPVHLLVLSGMEHVWQCLFSLSYVHFVWKYIESERAETTYNTRRILPYLCLSAMLLTAFRYEGMFIILASGLIFLGNRQIKALLLSGFFASIPILLYGFFSLSKGGYFFPNSLLIKGHLPSSSLDQVIHWGYRMVESLYENPFILLSVIFLMGVLFIQKLRPATRQCVIIILLSFGLHILLAEVGGYRYEAYLLLLSMMVVPIVLKESKAWDSLKVWFSLKNPQLFWSWGLLAVCLFPFLVRSLFFTANYARSSKNIYQQQYQMARFLQTYYPTAPVAANDIGAITYFTDIQLLDLVGIGSQDILRLKREGTWDAEHIGALAKEAGIEIAICYDSWVGEVLPVDWEKVGTWTISDNFICADETVSFYAVKKSSRSSLLANLRSFEPELPSAVIKNYE